MKKLLVLALCVFVFVALAAAQNPTYVAGSQGGIHGIDKLGAHNNAGRGCTGCHAPHSGGKGGGGSTGTASVAFNDPTSGNAALWGQDLTTLYGKVIATGDAGKYTATLPATNDDSPIVTGVMMCLSCHDGNYAKGGMMTNQSYEQAAGLLPANLYGTGTIPTLLGNDGTTVGNYNNDHPVGQLATLGALSTAFNGYFTVAYNSTADSYKWTVTATNNAAYTQFVANYGAPTFLGRTAPVLTGGDVNPNDAYVVCTTCHGEHSMYTVSASGSSPIAGLTSGVFPTYFFLTGPYNPGSLAGKTGSAMGQASSATQFCRQCHFTGAGGSNEGSGIMNVTTAF